MSNTNRRTQNYFVAFVDILGFKELVSAANRQKLEQCFSICEELIKYWQDTEGKSSFKVYNFSDSIVLLVPSENGRELVLFRHLCIALADLQFHLAKNNIWVRGGVSYGEMEISESPVQATQKFLRMYGKPLIQAYEIESKIAKFPRIVIDPILIEALNFETATDFIKEVNQGIDYSNWKGEVIFSWPTSPCRIPHDVPLFIDYLEYLFHDFGHFEAQKYENFIDVIRKNLNKSPQHYEKYRWVADYLMSKQEIKIKLPIGTFLNFAGGLHKI